MILVKPQLGNGTEESTAVFIAPKVMAAAGRWALWLSPAHLAAASLLLLMFLVSIFLALQYAVKYRKYQVAEDLDSLTDNSGNINNKFNIKFKIVKKKVCPYLYFTIIYVQI